MRPYIICHMLSSVDGKIDGSVLRSVAGPDEYESTGSKLNGDAWICGRTTMQQHFADAEPFVSTSNTPAGPQPVHVARRSESYAISVDTTGKLRWSKNDIGGDHLICVVSEQTPADYLSMLQDRGISCIVSGATSIDLPRAVDLLGNTLVSALCCSKEAVASTERSWSKGLSMRSAFCWRRALMAGTRFLPFSMASSPQRTRPSHSG